jgi:penicillin-binding protein 1A
MGNGQYGFATAADYYFGRPLSSFTTDDAGNAALLAGIPKSPRDYAPGVGNEARALHRRNQILALMVKHGFLSPAVNQAAGQCPIQFAAAHPDWVREGNSQSPAVVDNAFNELETRQSKVSVEDLFQGKIQVYTTVDTRVQRIVDQALESGLATYEKRHSKAKGIIQGSIVVLRNSDASILAETGGRQFYNQHAASRSDFNRVTQSLRQPGSTMKPIVYLAAFRQGPFTLETIVPDEPIAVADGGKLATKSISNYDGQFKGMIPLREALAESRNAVAVWITEQVGIEHVLETARLLGVETPLRPYVTTALGASEMNLLELANVYRTIASGNRARPHIIRQIVRDSGEVVINDLEERSGSVDDEALALIQEGLRGVVRVPTGTAHALDSTSFPIAVMGKTGTTSNFKDALFVGSTFGRDGITIAVRIGFDDSHSLGAKETGAQVALPVFRQIMLRIYKEKLTGPAPKFPPDMEARISAYLNAIAAPPAPKTVLAPPSPTASLTRSHEGQTWWRSTGVDQKLPN